MANALKLKTDVWNAFFRYSDKKFYHSYPSYPYAFCFSSYLIPFSFM